MSEILFEKIHNHVFIEEDQCSNNFRPIAGSTYTNCFKWMLSRLIMCRSRSKLDNSKSTI